MNWSRPNTYTELMQVPRLKSIRIAELQAEYNRLSQEEAEAIGVAVAIRSGHFTGPLEEGLGLAEQMFERATQRKLRSGASCIQARPEGSAGPCHLARTSECARDLPFCRRRSLFGRAPPVWLCVAARARASSLRAFG